MKKLLLSGLLALCGAAGYAQNSATVAQTGVTNSASAIQSGSSLTATISQVGSLSTRTEAVISNTATTNQTGTGHTATINQNNGSRFNRAYATQIGTGPGSNSATLSQSNGSGGAAARGGDRSIVTGDVGNFSGTYQTGSSNQATVNQDGSNSKANLGEISQRGTGNTATTTQSNGAKSNVAQTFQGYDLADVTSNTAIVNQNGGTENFATVNQFNNGNIATVTQTAAISNTATIDQTGTIGNATINQLDNATSNIALIQQVSGSNSGAVINQTTYAGATLMNDASIIQYGDRQVAVTTQDFASNSFLVINQGSASTTSSDNRADSRQINGVTSSTAIIDQNTTASGSLNKARIDQYGITALNYALVSQQGSSNEAGLIQTGTGSNTATVSQTGDFNIVGGPGTVVEPPYGTLSNNSYAKQDGATNKMTVVQTAATGVATALLHNAALLSQTGDGNILSVTQTIGSDAMGGNMATANQTGMGNQAIIQQTGTMP